MRCGEATVMPESLPPELFRYPGIAPALTGDGLTVGLDHLRYQLLERRPVAPAEPLVRLGRIAQQLVDLGWTEIARIDADEHLAVAAIDTDLVGAAAAPLDPASNMRERELDELADGMALARCQHI